MPRILIADDHPILRRGLIQLLKESLPIARIYEVDAGDKVVPLLREHRMEAVVLDISLPGKDGMIVLGEIKREFPTLPVLMLSIRPEEQYAARALRLGASGYLNKAAAPEELVCAVRRVLQGGTYINEATSGVLLDTIRKPDSGAPHITLSERETQVMLMIASGKTLSEIAAELNLSVKTVSTYRSRLLEKMQLRNNSQLTHYVYKHKLMSV